MKKVAGPGFSKRAIFLDRDGTINEDPGYLRDPAQVKLIPGVGPALAELKKAGFLLIVISNQSGVGRGLIQKEAIPEIHKRLDELLGEWEVKIDHYGLCFHHPDENCICRKPKPHLIVEAARTFEIDIRQSFMVGDRISDLQAGAAAGCSGSVLVKTGAGLVTLGALKEGEASFVAESLEDASRWILWGLLP